MQKNLALKDISALDFTNQCARIADTYSSDASLVDGDIFAHLATRLIAAEIRPGGPYRDEGGRPTVQLNATIGRLFLLMGKTLPNVDKYLHTPHDHLSDADRSALDYYRATQNTMMHTTRHRQKQHPSYARAIKTLSGLDEPVRAQALQFLARVEAADTTSEIASIAGFTKRALVNVAISPAKLQLLGEANVHSWIAYTIYDHILDKEAGAALLPAANICMRIAFTKYKQALPARHPMQMLIAQYFDKVDAISAWEVTSCRFEVADEIITIHALPDYQQYEALAWRSCIHILGPLIVAASSPMSATQAKQFTKGLHHYLIARQLGDDIHDWREDLAAGRISAVVALLLARQNIEGGYARSLAELIPVIQKDFLYAGAAQISKLILHHTERAFSELTAAGCDSTSELIGLVTRLERMANESIRHQQRFVGFQDRYKPSKAPLVRKLPT